MTCGAVVVRFQRGPEISIRRRCRQKQGRELLLGGWLAGAVGGDGEEELEGVRAGLLASDNGGFVLGTIPALGR